MDENDRIRLLGLAPEQQLYCGMALGYSDLHAAVNALRAERVGVGAFTTFLTD